MVVIFIAIDYIHFNIFNNVYLVSFKEITVIKSCFMKQIDLIGGNIKEAVKRDFGLM